MIQLACHNYVKAHHSLHYFGFLLSFRQLSHGQILHDGLLPIFLVLHEAYIEGGCHRYAQFLGHFLDNRSIICHCFVLASFENRSALAYCSLGMYSMMHSLNSLMSSFTLAKYFCNQGSLCNTLINPYFTYVVLRHFISCYLCSWKT